MTIASTGAPSAGAAQWPPPFPFTDEATPAVDPVARAALWCSALWLWWVGTLLGLALAAITLRRLRGRTDPAARRSRRWAIQAVIVGAVGLVTLTLVVTLAAVPDLLHRAQDGAAKHDLGALYTEVAERSHRAGGIDLTAVGRPATWVLPGGSGVQVLGPFTSATRPGQVSAELWDLASPSGSGRSELFEATVSSTGTCWYLAAQPINSPTQLDALYTDGQAQGTVCDADDVRLIVGDSGFSAGS